MDCGGGIMRIVVCVKQVPSASSVKIDPETHRLVREGVQSVVNPYDLYALQWALNLKKKTGSEVTALCMGPPSAKNTLYEALAMGADNACLLSDKKFGGSDTLVTSRILAEGIRKLGDTKLVLCGKQAIDGDTAQVGPGISAHLEWAQATSVTAIDEPDDDFVTVTRMFDSFSDRVRCRLPAVIALEKTGPRPRVPSLKDWLSAVEKEIVLWGVDDLGLENVQLGLKGSPTKVAGTKVATFGDKETVVLEGNAESTATQLFIELARRGLY